MLTFYEVTWLTEYFDRWDNSVDFLPNKAEFKSEANAIEYIKALRLEKGNRDIRGLKKEMTYKATVIDA